MVTAGRAGRGSPLRAGRVSSLFLLMNRGQPLAADSGNLVGSQKDAVAKFNRLNSSMRDMLPQCPMADAAKLASCRRQRVQLRGFQCALFFHVPSPWQKWGCPDKLGMANWPCDNHATSYWISQVSKGYKRFY